MKVQSTIFPSEFLVRKTELGNSHVLLRKNIEEKQIQEEEQEEITTVYEYDEVEVVIANRVNLADYITTNFEVLFEQGLLRENEPKTPSDKERLEALEDAMLEVVLNG